MKSAILVFSFFVIACSNAGDGAAARKDSLDSVGHEQKRMIDSAADRSRQQVDSIEKAGKEMVDSTTKARKKLEDRAEDLKIKQQ